MLHSSKEVEMEEEEEEENENFESSTDADASGSQTLDISKIPVRISSAEIKESYHTVKGETVDDAKGIQHRTAAYCCKNCGKTYESEVAIEDHVLFAHRNILRYTCEACGQRFGLKSALDSHIEEAHPQDA